MSNPARGYLTPAQVAVALQVDIQTVRKWLREGRLAGVRVGRLWRVKAGAVGRGVALGKEVRP